MTAVPILVDTAVVTAVAVTVVPGAVVMNRLMTWRMDHGFLSDQVLHGLGSGWSTAT